MWNLHLEHKWLCCNQDHILQLSWMYHFYHTKLSFLHRTYRYHWSKWRYYSSVSSRLLDVDETRFILLENKWRLCISSYRSFAASRVFNQCNKNSIVCVCSSFSNRFLNFMHCWNRKRPVCSLFSLKKLFTNHHVAFGLFVMTQFENVYVHISYYSIEEVM